MPQNREGMLIVLSGPSGVGKDSVLKKILEKRKDLKLSVSCTTRFPRDGEVNGKDYHFVTKQQFEEFVKNGDLLEYACYCNNYYGTLQSEVEKELKSGNSIILEIEVQGAQKIFGIFPDAVSIFLLPPSLEALRRRLKGRALDDCETVERRVAEAEKEINVSDRYRYAVINDDIDDCVRNIINIIDLEHMK